MIKAAINIGWVIPKGEDDMADAAHLAEMSRNIYNGPSDATTRKQREVLHALPDYNVKECI